MKIVIVPAMLLFVLLSSTSSAQDSQALSELKKLRDQIDNRITQLEKIAEAEEKVAKADIPKARRVMLSTRDGYYLRAKLGGGDDLVADVKLPKGSEVFTLEWLSPNSVRLRTRDGHYVGARRGGGANVDAKVKEPRTSEVFVVEWQDAEHTKLRLRTREGFYIHPVGGGGGDVDVRCTRSRGPRGFWKQ